MGVAVMWLVWLGQSENVQLKFMEGVEECVSEEDDAEIWRTDMYEYGGS